MANSAVWHEAEEHLTPATRDLHRALTSLQEELEAIDWYGQRIDAVQDADLREVLSHARDEEMEHASMILEWIRRHSPAFEGALRMRLFVDGSIVGREEALEDAEGAAPAGTNGSPGRGDDRGTRLTVGPLREDR